MTIFSKIIAGEIPSYKIAENEKFFAFLDIFPLREGHVLVVPKTEIDNLFDLPEEYLAELLTISQGQLPKQLRKVLIAIVVVSALLVWKCHMHICILFLSILPMI